MTDSKEESPIDRLLGIMARLRDPKDGCPWDREQSFATIAPYTIEEAYEVADAIERGDMAALKDELGDLLFQVVFYAEMAQELGVPAQFRIKHTRHTYLVGNYLDLGPSGVEVPQVETEATAEEAVQNFYYPQTGIRSWGGLNRVGLDGREDRLEYAAWWAETGVLWLQLESVESVTKARRLAMPGVDCLSFGPADLSFSLEAHGHSPFNTVDECAAYVVEQLEGTDSTLAMRVPTPEDRQKYIDMGARVLLVQSP